MPIIRTPRCIFSAPVCLLVLALAAACGDATDPGPRLTVSADSVGLWVGESVQLSAQLGGGTGAVQWQSTTPAIVSVDQTGRVTALARGAGGVRATAGGATAEVEVSSFPVIRGRAHSPNGGDLAALRARWETAQKADSVQLAADGSFIIRATTLETAGELRIDGAAPRAFHPFLYPFHVDSLADVDVVLVPRAWTIRRGLYTGQTVPLSLDLVMDEEEFGFSYFKGQWGEDLASYWAELQTWPLEHLPAKVAIDHTHSSPAVTPADSVGLWEILDRMEVIFGLDLFQPVVGDPAWWPEAQTWTPVAGVIRMGYEDGLTGATGTYSTLPKESWAQDLGAWAAGSPFTRFLATRELANGGWIRLGGSNGFEFSDEGERGWVTGHEMLHVLGAGHTCKMQSPQGPCMRTMEASPNDVAYLEMLREVLLLERAHDTFLGLMPATIGERRVMLGLSALPTLRPR